MRRGFIAAQPLTIGVAIYGMAFGMLALGSGLSLAEAVLMSLTVYSGSAQTAAVGALASGAGLGAIAVTVGLLNARYILYGAALRPWLGGVAPWRAYGTLYFLGDANWVLAMRAREAGEVDAGYVFGSSVALFLPWAAGSLAGGLAGGWVPDPRALALDFFLVAFCAAMLVGMLRTATSPWPAVAALVAALVADRWLPAGWAIVAAGVAGMLTAAWRTPADSEEAA